MATRAQTSKPRPAPTTKRAPGIPAPQFWQAPRLEAWQKEALEQGFFDWALPKHEKLVTTQVARALALSPNSVIALIECGRLEAFAKQIKGKRIEYTITRRSVLHYIASTSQLDPRDWLQAVVNFLTSLDDRMLGLVGEAYHAEHRRRHL